MSEQQRPSVTRMVGGLTLAITLFCALAAWPQEQASGTAPAEQGSTPGVAVDSARKTVDIPGYTATSENAGTTWGEYEVRQNFEAGGRIANPSGNLGVWDSYVNLYSGPRLLEESLDLHSATHTGFLFDDLTFSNFGYGGDPNDVTRLQVQKGTLYRFNGSFRRDKNFFDYDLLANPLNPPNSNPNVPITFSPHLFETTRNMSDFSLYLFDQAPVQLRFGYGHYSNDGSAFSSTHQGTEGLLLQPTRNTSDNYQFGISVRVLPRTSLNYDQFVTHYKNDSSWQLDGTPQTLASGAPVNLGLSFNTPAGQPCSTPLLAGGFANPFCNSFFSYTRFSPIRNTYPVEQLSFQSAYFHAVDMSGRASYSSSDSDRPNYLETFNGFTTRNADRIYTQSGPGHARRVNTGVDYATTIHVTDKFRIVDSFRFSNFRIPSTFALSENDLFGPGLNSTPNTYNPATCPPPFTAAACPQHTSSSGPDAISSSIHNFLGQNMKINTFDLEYDFTRWMTAHMGFRYQRRDIDVGLNYVQVGMFFPNLPTRGGCTQVVNNVCTLTTVFQNENDFVEINGYSGIFGISARPVNTLRISFDTELYSADNTFTRIIPRQFQDYRVRASYRPKQWVDFASAIVIREGRNNTTDVGHLEHNRSYAFTTAVTPNDKFSLDLDYDYNDVFSRTNICFVTTPSPPVSISCGGNPFAEGISFYTEYAHSGGGGLQFRPIPRVSTGIGYTITSSVGSTIILNPNAPTGPLSYNYHLPQANIAIDLTKHLTYKTGWNLYDYHEKSNPGPTAPRNFRGNVFTLSMRYSL